MSSQCCDARVIQHRCTKCKEHSLDMVDCGNCGDTHEEEDLEYWGKGDMFLCSLCWDVRNDPDERKDFYRE